MKFLIFEFILASFLLEADSLRIKAQFPPKSAKRQSRLVLSGTLPPLTEVTVCQWINPHVDRPKGMYMVSYAHKQEYNELLIGILHVPRGQSSESSDQQMKLILVIRGNATEVRVQGNKEFPIMGKWRHICFTWSSGNGLMEAYLDGTLVGSPSTPLQAGKEIRAGGVLMIGQDQDSVNGGFDPDQAWEGYISEVHMWDERLTKKQIAALSRCEGKLEGNVFAWMRSPLTAEDGVVLSRTSLCDE